MKNMTKRKFISFFLAMTMLFLALPLSPISSYAVGEEEEEAVNSTDPYRLKANVGKQAIFDWWTDFLLVDTETLLNSTADEMSAYYGDSEVGYENWVLFDEIPANDLVLIIKDYHYDAENGFHWYKMGARAGETLPEALEQEPWVLYTKDIDLEFGYDPYLAVYEPNEVIRIINPSVNSLTSVRFVLSGPDALADATVSITDYAGEYSESSLAYVHEEYGTWSSALRVELTKANGEAWTSEDGNVGIRYTASMIATNNYVEDVCYGAAFLYIDDVVYSASVTDKTGYDASDVVYTNAAESIVVIELLIPDFEWFAEPGYFTNDGVTLYDNHFNSKDFLAAELPVEFDAGYVFYYNDEEYYWLENDGFVGSPYFLVKAEDVTLGKLPAEFGDGRVTVTDEDRNAVSEITLSQYEKPVYTAISSLTRMIEEVKYQWQLEYEEGKWVNIYGANAETVKLTYGMVASLLDDGEVNIRCKSQAGTKSAYSKPIPVTVETYVPEEPAVEVSDSCITSAGKVVTVTAAGSIPEDATIRLEETDSTGVAPDAGETVLAALDISIQNADGTQWQPESDESVQVTLKASELGLKNGDRFVVYHLHDGKVQLLGVYIVKNDIVVFEVNGFSKFVFAMAAEETQTPDFSTEVGKNAIFTRAEDMMAVIVLDAEPNADNIYDTILYDVTEFPEDVVFNIVAYKVVDEYYDITSATTGEVIGQGLTQWLWYQVCVESGDVPEDFEDGLWILQNYLTEADAWEADTLILYTPEPVVPSVSVTVDGEAVTEITVSTANKVTLTAMLNVAGINTSYQWQLYVPASDTWVDIYGQTAADCTVNYGMVANRLDSDGKAQVRCMATVDGQTIIGEPIAVNIASAASSRTRTTRTSRASAGAVTKYTVTVYYYIGDGTVMHREVHTMEFGVNEEEKTTSFPIPVREGYTAYYFGENANTGKDNGTKYTETEYTLENFKPTSDMSLYVRYYPNENTRYRVEYYVQNVYDDGYTLYDSKTLYGTTDTYIPAFDASYQNGTLAMNLEALGFYAAPYKRDTISASGNTVVKIYYDRYMYLLLFDLGEGGMGVDPVYGRHGVEYTVNTPTRLGYTFDGWVDWDGNSVAVTTDGKYTFTLPVKDATVTAKWIADNASYTIVFWHADLDDGDPSTPTTYSYWGKATVGSVAGTVLTPATVGDQNNAESCGGDYFDNKEAPYYSYDAEVTADKNPATVAVKGDGSTVVNVYYNRKIFEIRYLFARRATGDTGNSDYEIATLTRDGKVGNWQASSGALPTLKDNAGFGIKTEVINGYTYYYISVRAEYDADIESQWPADVLNARGNYSFGSWAAEDGTGYRKNDPEHANIVGSYPYMSGDMVKAGNEDIAYTDPDTGELYYVAQRMSAWWGTDFAWNPASISAHSYHIYYEVLDGTGDRQYNGKWYNLVRTLDFVAAHNGDTRVDPFYYVGYECVNDTRGANNSNLNSSTDYQKNSENYENTTKNKNAGRYNCPDNSCEYCNCFYYDREDYTLSFYNHNEATNAAGKTFAPAGLKFEQVISEGLPEDETAPYEPDYPVGLDIGGYYFDGWYTTDQCFDETKVDWNATMPAGDLMVYAKWAPVTHTIEFYFDETLSQKLDPVQFHTQNVLHNEYGVDPGLPGHPLDFEAVTWFYKDANGEEKTFAFDMSVKQDMKLYPKWRTNVYINYEVRYKVYDRINQVYTDIEIADRYYGEELYGELVTLYPKGTEDFYDAYKQIGNGYFPMSGSHSISMGEESCSADPPYLYCTWDAETSTHIFTFYYVNGPTSPYTVEYHEVDANGNFVKKLIGDKRVEDNYYAKVVENAAFIPGYMPDEAQKTLYVVLGNENKIIFLYTVDATASFYRVSHWIKKYGSTEYTLVQKDDFASHVNDIISDYPPLSLPGVNYTHTVIAPDSKVVGTSVNGQPGLTVDIYYEEEGVTIHYAVKGPDGCGTLTLYTETIGAYYGTVSGSQAKASSNAYKFFGWYSDFACSDSVSYDTSNNKFVPSKVGGLHVATTYYAKFEYNLTRLTIVKDGWSKTDPHQTFLFTITDADGLKLTVTVHEDGSATIDGLTVGKEYTITEKTDWSWRYKYGGVDSDGTTVNVIGTVTDGVKFTLNPTGNTITFTNTREQSQWLDGDSWCDNLFQVISGQSN